MNSRKALLTLAGALTLLASACGTASPTPEPLTVAEAASTLVASTFQAATRSAALNTPTPLPSATPTFAKPLLYIGHDASCRTGTTPNFKIVATLTAGTTVEMIGKDTPQSAWLVRAPGSANTCWVQALDGSPSGDFETLPEVTPQPSTQKLPGAPAIVGWPWICSYSNGVIYKFTINLSWIDPSHDANGFRVYRSNTQVADLPAGTTTFTDTTDVVLGSQLTYSVEAYNDAGVSPRAKTTISSICK
jgi:hypothetical protein